MESDSNKLSLFQKAQLSITLLSLLSAITFGALNYFSSQEKVLLKDENNLLKSDIVLYKDSLNIYKTKEVERKLIIENDTMFYKNYPLLK